MLHLLCNPELLDSCLAELNNGDEIIMLDRATVLAFQNNDYQMLTSDADKIGFKGPSLSQAEFTSLSAKHPSSRTWK